jgi:hypothetical protein
MRAGVPTPLVPSFLSMARGSGSAPPRHPPPRWCFGPREQASHKLPLHPPVHGEAPDLVRAVCCACAARADGGSTGPVSTPARSASPPVPARFAPPSTSLVAGELPDPSLHTFVVFPRSPPRPDRQRCSRLRTTYPVMTAHLVNPSAVHCGLAEQ